MTEAATTTQPQATLDERVARLRAEFLSLPQGRDTLIELTPTKMIRTDPDVHDFSAWSQWSQWPQSY